MQRLLISVGDGQLEERFAKSNADQKALKLLEQELQFR